MPAPWSIRATDALRLSAVAAFYGGFTPMSEAVVADTGGGSLRLAFLDERDWSPVAATLTQHGAALTVHPGRTGPDAGAAPQLRRMLGLDADPDAWSALGEREPVVGRLQAAFPGFLTAAFPSPYEAGIGGILAQRTSMRAAAATRRRLADVHGTQIDGLRILPSPRALLAADAALPGIPDTKWRRLRAWAAAALDGQLDAEHLRALDPADALARLRALPGIGPWTAEHALLRGAAPSDGLPLAEPRVRRAVALACGLARDPTPGELVAIAQPWRPYRMWVAVLCVRALAAAGRFHEPVGAR